MSRGHDDTYWYSCWIQSARRGRQPCELSSRDGFRRPMIWFSSETCLSSRRLLALRWRNSMLENKCQSTVMGQAPSSTPTAFALQRGASSEPTASSSQTACCPGGTTGRVREEKQSKRSREESSLEMLGISSVACVLVGGPKNFFFNLHGASNSAIYFIAKQLTSVVSF